MFFKNLFWFSFFLYFFIIFIMLFSILICFNFSLLLTVLLHLPDIVLHQFVVHFSLFIVNSLHYFHYFLLLPLIR